MCCRFCSLSLNILHKSVRPDNWMNAYLMIMVEMSWKKWRPLQKLMGIDDLHNGGSQDTLKLKLETSLQKDIPSFNQYSMGLHCRNKGAQRIRFR